MHITPNGRNLSRRVWALPQAVSRRRGSGALGRAGKRRFRGNDPPRTRRGPTL